MSSGNSWSDEDVTQEAYGTEVRTDVLKLTLYDLNSSIAPREHRLMALQAALAELDHEDERKHDEELDLHADKIIFQKLCYAVQTNRSSEEVAMLCMALEMVYRASRSRLALSFSEIRESLLPLAVDMLAKPPHVLREEADEAEEKVKQISRHTSKSGNVARDYDYESKHDEYTSTDEDRSSFGPDDIRSNFEPKSVMSGNSSAFSKRKTPVASVHSRYIDQGSVTNSYNQRSAYEKDSASQFSKGSAFDKKKGTNATVASTQASSADEDESFYDGQSTGYTGHNSYNDDVSKDETDDHPSFHHSAYQYDEHSEAYSRNDDQQRNMGGTVASKQYEEESLVSGMQSRQSTKQGRMSDNDYDQGIVGPGVRDEYRDQGSIISGPGENKATRLRDDYNDQGSMVSGPTQSVTRAYYGYHDQASISGRAPRAAPDNESHGKGNIVSGPARSPNSRPMNGDYDEGSIVSGPSQIVSRSYYEYHDRDSNVSGPTNRVASGSQVDNLDQGSFVSGPPRSGEVASPIDYECQESLISGSVAQDTGSRDIDQGSNASGPVRSTTVMSREDCQDRATSGPDRGTPQSEFEDQESIISGLPRNTATGFRGGDQASIISGFARSTGSPDDFHGQGSIISGPAQSIALQSRQDQYGQQSVVSDPVRGVANGSRNLDCGQGSIVSGPSQSYASLSRGDSFKPGSVMSGQSQSPSLASRGQYSDQGSVVSGPAQGNASRSRNDYDDQGSVIRENDDVSELESSYRRGDGHMMEGDSTLDLTEYTENYEGDDQHPRIHNPRVKAFNNLETIGEAASHEESSRVSHVESRSKHAKESLSTLARSLRAQKEEKERQVLLENRRFFKEEWEMIRSEPATHPDGVGRLLLILRYLSRVLSAMVPMAEHPGLLEALIYQLECQPYDTEVIESELAPWRIDAIATIVNLACAEENKGTILEEKGLLDVVMRVAEHDPSEEAREHAAIVLMNLAYSDENKEPMVEHLGLLDTLIHLVRDDHEFTRRYATAALFTLACVSSNSERMIRHGDGEVLEVLRQVLEADPVDEARINAAEAIFNIARNNNEESAQILVSHPGLLSTIADAVLTDCTADARLYCARALEWLAADLHHPMESHEPFLMALTRASQWTKTNCVAEAMKTQALVAENRIFMAQHPGLLDALGNLAMLKGYSFADVRSSALAALELMSRDYESRIWMVRNSAVMQSLTKATFELDANGEPLTAQEHTNSNLIKEALKNLTTAV